MRNRLVFPSGGMETKYVWNKSTIKNTGYHLWDKYSVNKQNLYHWDKFELKNVENSEYEWEKYSRAYTNYQGTYSMVPSSLIGVSREYAWYETNPLESLYIGIVRYNNMNTIEVTADYEYVFGTTQNKWLRLFRTDLSYIDWFIPALINRANSGIILEDL